MRIARILFMLVAVCAVTSCAVIPTDFLPKPVFVFSREYKDYKQSQRNYQHMVDTLPTNSPAW